MTDNRHISFLRQICYLLMFEAGVVCALWQKGDVRLTLAVLCAAPLLMLLSRIPERFLPGLPRALLQFGAIGAALAWVQYCLMGNCHFDIVLIESSAVFGTGIFIKRSQREYSLLSLVCFAFAGYGGMMPGRQIYPAAFLVLCLCFTILLYQSRTEAFLDSRNVDHIPKFRGNWVYQGVHLALVLCVAIYGLSHFRLTRRITTKGIVPVTFANDQELQFPQLWQDWFKPMRKISDEASSKQTQEGNQKPAEESPAAKMKTYKRSSRLKARDGNGGSSSSIGRALLFRAYSPAKLYWAMQMYDTYDGDEWTQSQSLLRGGSQVDEYTPETSYEIVQQISLLHSTGDFLPYVYRCVSAKEMMSVEKEERRLSGSGFSMPLRINNISLVYKGSEISEYPCNYKVQSIIPGEGTRRQERAWNEPARNNGWTYRQLPADKMSDRLYDLAQEICKDQTTTKGKADAIRDHLRSNYAYRLDGVSVPQDKETVDYFLFESRAGYCQHFAQAFVVLARMAGLQARLVTGFSPGNFNVLTECFEVYEYHAHAWCQIFIEPYGWLTYDGVAPGNLDFGESSLLSAMLNPFKDKQDARPPELTYEPPQDEKNKVTTRKDATGEVRSDLKSIAEYKTTLYDEIYDESIRNNRFVTPSASQLLAATWKVLKSKSKMQLKALRQWLIEKWGTLKERLLRWLDEGLAKMKSGSKAMYACCGAVFALLALLWVLRRRIFRAISRLWRYHKCRRLLRLMDSGKNSREWQISHGAYLANEYLELAGFHRPGTADMKEAAAMLPNPIAADYSLIADAACSFWYGGELPEEMEPFLASVRQLAFAGTTGKLGINGAKATSEHPEHSAI